MRYVKITGAKKFTPPIKPKYRRSKNVVEFFLKREEQESGYAADDIYAYYDSISFYFHDANSIKKYLDDPEGAIPKSGEVSILFTYPLGNAARLTFNGVNTRLDLALAIYRGYKFLYAKDEGRKLRVPNLVTDPKSIKDPEIWGHELRDLSFSEVVFRNRCYRLGVSS